ncbi:MAG: ABC transporter permease [Thermoanaerobaculia bacterium]|nr:ABC transporter permease [Thermoanaerobaculia bacterium]
MNPPAPIDPKTASTPRPFLWSVRRELWENRSIYLAPILVAAVWLLGFLISTIHWPARLHAAASLDRAAQWRVLGKPFAMVGIPLVLVAIVVGVVYCLDALSGERRDRSILFWKSLPVSDVSTVLAKASIPLLVLPALTAILVLVTQLLMLGLGTAVLVGNGLSPAPLWRDAQLFQESLMLVYGLIALVLWHAPIYSVLLFVSSWARRAAVLWAILPVLAFGVLEKVAFNSGMVCSLVKYRTLGVVERAFAFTAPGGLTIDPLRQLTPAQLLSTPGLWLGLVVAAVFLAAAVRFRRWRGPI